jgi:hypothetical protein
MILISCVQCWSLYDKDDTRWGITKCGQYWHECIKDRFEGMGMPVEVPDGAEPRFSSLFLGIPTYDPNGYTKRPGCNTVHKV